MATYADFPDLHVQAGARWLVPFSAIVLATLIAAIAMFVYPHMTA